MNGRRPPMSRPVSARDLSVIRSIGVHRVMSGDQLRRLHFPVSTDGSGSAPRSGGDSRVILGVGHSPGWSSAVTVSGLSRSG
jgi:hypothetical protein